ncbi:Acetate kinase [Stanieria cyanosphaera PCC 7437]|uniref:Acetate kinase n=1 Tax=Stanieria cyanosphaera (strain ATCC 29371 / PCC 7437) TaxID=111780 RepID=K9XS64_STAC7|nr:acetate kinase [Stanieria cyanosphaera]AFZ34512.1 Acetate kinase [Stanieria cyanosphaera PCC 7437]
MKILVLNAGSSSQKSCLYQLPSDLLPATPLHPLWEANLDLTVSRDNAKLTVKTQKITKEIRLSSQDTQAATAQMLETLVSGDTKVLEQLSDLDVVGHRVVHGGTEYSQATKITPNVKETISRLIPLAPNHNPAHLQGIEAVENLLGDVTQIAVFDTAFHSQMPLEAVIYPIPYHWYEQGIRRYGFHGISHQYCAHQAAQIINQPLASLKLITCHLGNGCSLAAIKNGVSINTTMGFTPLEGLMMGTRSGSIDPAILIYLLREHNFSADDLDQMLNKESGIKGISGLSSDLRIIRDAIAEGNQRAQLALDLFIHRLITNLGAMIASLGGLDVLVFTAGIGENAAIVRERVASQFEFLGLKLDLAKNNSSPQDENIAASDSKIQVLVIHTNEDWAIACKCWRLIH